MSKFDETPKITSIEENIVLSALQYNGQIFTGRTHYEAIMELEKALPDDVFKKVDMRNVEEGFITNTGRYVSKSDWDRRTPKSIRKAR